MNLNTILPELVQYSILLKMYHWQTKSYARHVAADSLYKNVNEFMDELVEYDQGVKKRINIEEQCISIHNMNDTNAVWFLKMFSVFISSISIPDKGIIAKRDELIGLIHQTLYLFKLK